MTTRRTARLLAAPALAALALGAVACSGTDARTAAAEPAEGAHPAAAGVPAADPAPEVDPGAESVVGHGPGVDASVRGDLKPNQPMEVAATCAGSNEARYATTFGPSGTLTPAADADYLLAGFTAPTTIPARPAAGHAVTVTCGDGATATVVLPESVNDGR